MLLLTNLSKTTSQAGGQIGSHLVSALLATGKHNLTALTRASSPNTASLPSAIKKRTIDYADHDSLVSALRGQDFLIISLSVFAPATQQPKLIAAAQEAGVKWVMPNEYGTDYEKFREVGEDTRLGPPAVAIRELVREAGMSFVALACGFWYEFGLAGTAVRYGFDFGKREMTFYDDGETKITTSTWPQCGRAVAALLSLPVLPMHEQDGQLTLSRYRNSAAFVGSFRLSQRDMFASVLRVTGTEEAEWKVGFEGAEARFRRGGELLAQGSMEGFGMLLYARAFYKGAAADYQALLSNEELGLPEEELDEATAVAVQMAERASE